MNVKTIFAHLNSQVIKESIYQRSFMDQLSLFPENVEVIESLEKVPSQLEVIAHQAANHPFLFEERGENTSSRRYQRFERYAKGEVVADLYLIKNQGKLIGAAYIWKGWLSAESDYVEPAIELAFIAPASQIHEGVIVKKLFDAILQIKATRS